MSDYMTNCHYKYSVDEEPTSYGEFRLREKLFFLNREFWVWSCKDGFGRTWDVVVGRDEPSFHPDSQPPIWMFGALHEKRYDPREIIVNEFPELIHETGKIN
ncbi:hypothetical protein [Hoeflea prorocentri]|uniref:Uncharacterized protein n=1 Tax=Hoeflea prorocentri TaxID=1922333 RepID=A0A9X3UK27_9HYPH|nr:hypothetical protein [Hoeflea prorocentri]MCY6382104.1 hypothetical protein [Hoeflea prorocentri]MDA5399904.1 hypothetical protein [Hoeflea prorocentri]